MYKRADITKQIDLNNGINNWTKRDKSRSVVKAETKRTRLDRFTARIFFLRGQTFAYHCKDWDPICWSFSL